jgi:hypothetical protein
LEGNNKDGRKIKKRRKKEKYRSMRRNNPKQKI